MNDLASLLESMVETSWQQRVVAIKMKAPYASTILCSYYDGRRLINRQLSQRRSVGSDFCQSSPPFSHRWRPLVLLAYYDCSALDSWPYFRWCLPRCHYWCSMEKVARLHYLAHYSVYAYVADSLWSALGLGFRRSRWIFGLAPTLPNDWSNGLWRSNSSEWTAVE